MTTYTGPLEWVAVDFDGTLSGLAWTPAEPTKMGAPLWHNVRQMQAMRAKGWLIAIHTARGPEQREDILHWLDRNGIIVDDVICGKFLAHRYIDDRAIKAMDTNWGEQV